MNRLAPLFLIASVAAGIAVYAACKKDAPPAAEPAAATPAAEAGKPAEPAATKAAPGPDKLKAEGKGYQVEVTPAAGNTVVTLKATEGYHLNKEYPLSLTVTPGAGGSVAKDKLTIDDASKYEEKEGSWTIAETPGGAQTTALFKFAVCTEATCDPQKVELAWTLPAK